MKKLVLNSITLEKLKKLILGGGFKKKTIFNFMNSNDMYSMKTCKDFREGVFKYKNFNLIDGSMVSRILRGKRLRGPQFTKNFFNDLDLLKNKRHFFIGFEKADSDLLAEKVQLINRKNIFEYNPPYINGTFVFPKKERKKIIKLVNKQKIDYLWIGIGSPKQTILANQLYDSVKVKFIFAVGAAMDFLLEKKKEAPSFIQKIGLEWLFRLITDFRYTKKKVWQSLIGTFYTLGRVKKKEF